jgi:uncharacterized protein
MKKILFLLVAVHKMTFSFLKILFPLRTDCQFHPSCSAYFKESVERFGSAKGTWLGLKRIVRCHPLSQGGVDPLPER